MVGRFAPIWSTDRKNEVFKQRPFLVAHQVSGQADLHSRYQLESRQSASVNLEGSVRSAGIMPMPLRGRRADLIEAGLNEPEGRFCAMGIVALALAWHYNHEGERADEWCRTVG